MEPGHHEDGRLERQVEARPWVVWAAGLVPGSLGFGLAVVYVVSEQKIVMRIIYAAQGVLWVCYPWLMLRGFRSAREDDQRARAARRGGRQREESQ